MYPIIIMPHYPPPWQCWERGGDLFIQNSNAPPVGYATPSPHLKHRDLRGDLLINVHTSVHVYGEQSHSPS